MFDCSLFYDLRFVQNGADANKKNRDGHTPLDLVKEGDTDVEDLLRGMDQNDGRGGVASVILLTDFILVMVNVVLVSIVLVKALVIGFLFSYCLVKIRLSETGFAAALHIKTICIELQKALKNGCIQ